jgi:hypothetical protein
MDAAAPRTLDNHSHVASSMRVICRCQIVPAEAMTLEAAIR